ncbi:MAG: glycosyltransferase [Gaiellaceae bacterium MAG52_C11]|nr:glycosyltransferase [Candidatus Gaiellasilicea maunaloa]
MKLIFVTQQVDPADPVLGATVAKLRALAAQVDELVVLSLDAAPGSLPPNCRVRTFGGGTKAMRGLRFVRALVPELRGADAVLAHMCPIYALLAAPLARPFRVPVLLWFAHWRASSLLRAATAVSTNVLSVDRRSFPLETPKLVPLGHGIDFTGLECAALEDREHPGGEELRAIVLGRTSPAKGIETILRAVRQVPEARLDVYGTSGSNEERAHRAELERLIRELRLDGRAAIHDPVPRNRIGEIHANADVLINNMRAGAPDKAVYEACGSCLPVLASNPSFDGLFAGIEPLLRFQRESPDDLAARLQALAALSAHERVAIGRTLRERAVSSHSVDSWAAGVLESAARG